MYLEYTVQSSRNFVQNLFFLRITRAHIYIYFSKFLKVFLYAYMHLILESLDVFFFLITRFVFPDISAFDSAVIPSDFSRLSSKPATYGAFACAPFQKNPSAILVCCITSKTFEAYQRYLSGMVSPLRLSLALIEQLLSRNGS